MVKTYSARRLRFPLPPDAAVDAGDSARSRPGVPIAGMRSMNVPFGFSTGMAEGVLGAESIGVPRRCVVGG